jgi:DNA-binding MarR family transcriptional regulator
VVPPDWDGLASDERLSLMRLLVGAHTRLTRVLGAELEEGCNIPITWFVGMARLARAPGARLTMSELSAELSLTSGGVTRLVDRMVERGLVERQHCPSDRRSIYVALTDQGFEALRDATVVHLDGLDRHLLGPLDEHDRAALALALQKLGTDPTGCPG